MISPKQREQKSMLFLIGLNWKKTSMNIKLWYCKCLKQWRWTLIDDSESTIKQESGQQPDLRTAMNDVANTVEYMLKSN